jgi:very-short-patch-repair endonuclease
VGRHGLEHVGRHEEKDVRKDRMLRAVGWEVVRVRTGRLRPLGPHDIVAASVSQRLIERLDDELATIAGELMVASYRR